MKILMINGSPHPRGCTYTALHEMERVLRAAGAEVLGVVSIFTYGMKKGLDRLADEKIVNISMTNLDELCEAAAEDGRIAQGDIARILKFRDDPSDESWISGGNE